MLGNNATVPHRCLAPPGRAQLFKILHNRDAYRILQQAMNPHHDPAPEEAEMRAALTQALDAWLRASGLTQTAAAARLGTTQARVSEIKRGKTAQFSLDLLVRLAARAGMHPRLTFPPTR
jgi:predicted XRE-type DNA-binding protein